MEINNNDIRDEIIEFPSNFEEIANQELLKLEKNNKIDLNKLIKQSLEHDKNIIKENNQDKNNNENECEDFESDEEENIDNNNYQKFEDDDCQEDKKEEKNEIFESNNDNIEEKQINKINCNDNIFSNIKSVNKREQILEKNFNVQELINNKKNNLKTNKKKLSNEQMKKMLLKIEYTPPEWARNLSDQEFINKIQSKTVFLSK